MNLKRILIIVLIILVLVLLAIASGTYWAVGPSLRCGRPAKGPAQPGWSARFVNSGGVERCYYLYAPPGYDPGQPIPLVMSFHGFLSNPASHSLITGWHDLADEEGFMVVYPQGTRWPQRWNAGNTWGSDGDDVQFFHDLLDEVSSVAAVDKSRVYVNGFSNGGGMSVHLGCEAADRIAAIGSVAGAVVAKDGCTPSRPLPVIAFHGTSDPIVYYEGGEMSNTILHGLAGVTRAPQYFVGAQEWTATWAALNGCDANPENTPARGDTIGVRYTGCDQQAEVVIYTIDDGGHTWPGGTPIPFVGKTSNDIDATWQMWRFYQQYQLDGQP